MKGIATTKKKYLWKYRYGNMIKTALLASLSIILLTDSTTPMVKPIDIFAEADDFVDAVSRVYVSDDNSDNNNEDDAAADDSTTTNNDEEKKTG